MAHTDFFGLSVITAPGRVMTPRCASEALVRAALAHIGDRPARVADVGTGSGAIAVAIAARAPCTTVWATDTNLSALMLARTNAQRHGVADRVHCVPGDLLEGTPAELDVVVANLPYLPADEAWSRPELEREPREAVYAPGDGLDPYRRLLDMCEGRLAEYGLVAIQLHRTVLAATCAEIPALRTRIEQHAGRELDGAAGRRAA